jgi:hypothetical protein
MRTRTGFGRVGQIAHGRRRQIDGHRRARELLAGDDADERPFEFAPAAGDAVGQELDDLVGDHDGGIVPGGIGEPRLQDGAAQVDVGRLDADHQPAGQARAHARLEGFELARRHVGGDDHLALGIDQRVEGVAELLLHRLALEELEVVDQQHVDGLEIVLEGDGVAVLQGGDEMVHEALRGEIEHLDVGAGLADAPRDGVEQVGLALARRGMDVTAG